jgi:hypothetical protein
MNTEQLIKTAKAKLGNQVFLKQITNDMYNDLFSEAYNQFLLFSTLNKEIDKEQLDYLRKPWTNQYFLASVKECAGNLLSCSYENTFDYFYLLKEAESEKTALIKTLYPNYEYENKEDVVLIAVYISVGNLPDKEIDKLSEKVSKNLLNSLPHFIKSMIVPIKEGQSRVELIFSNDKNMNTGKIIDLYNQFKDLDSEIDKYLSETI